ncbi:heme ABC exporter ATP-binding protein CcmA [Hyphococcus sp. DH-69]|uniref:heme ABC exporter ATP-binding protein CcmA n=1 Tax=Hyphococcus formosus TaxID=3143534 RepID=UPI00398B2080
MEPYAHPITLEATDVGCDRAGIPVVRGVSFTLKPGRAIQLFGPNGSGKSSMLSMFAGLIPPTEGELAWHSDGDKRAKPFDGMTLFIGHETSVKLALTAKENLQFWTQLYGIEKPRRDERISQALDLVGASHFSDIRTGRLSAGQRRRIDLARAAIADRPIWLLDEPAAAIDATGVAVIGRMIEKHLEQGGIAIVATHDELGSKFDRLELGR